MIPFSQTIQRARLLFVSLIILVLTSSSSSLYLGWKSGEFESRFVSPVKTAVREFFAELESTEKTSESSPSGSWKKYVNVTPTPSKTGTNKTGTRVIIVTPKTQSGTSTYDQQVQKMNQDAAAAKAAQDAWWAEQQKNFEATKQQNQEWFDAAKAQQQLDMVQTQQENQARIDEFNAANGF